MEELKNTVEEFLQFLDEYTLRLEQFIQEINNILED